MIGGRQTRSTSGCRSRSPRPKPERLASRGSAGVGRRSARRSKRIIGGRRRSRVGRSGWSVDCVEKISTPPRRPRRAPGRPRALSAMGPIESYRLRTRAATMYIEFGSGKTRPSACRLSGENLGAVRLPPVSLSPTPLPKGYCYGRHPSSPSLAGSGYRSSSAYSSAAASDSLAAAARPPAASLAPTARTRVPRMPAAPARAPLTH